jgi:hypothetical protein
MERRGEEDLGDEPWVVVVVAAEQRWVDRAQRRPFDDGHLSYLAAALAAKQQPDVDGLAVGVDPEPAGRVESGRRRARGATAAETWQPGLAQSPRHRRKRDGHASGAS